MSFLSSTEIKTYLKIGSTMHDSFLTQLIGYVEAELKSLINQPILQTGLVIKRLELDVDGYIIIPWSVPTAVLSISYTMPFESTVYTLTPTTDYQMFYDGYVQKIWIKAGVNTEYVWNVSCAVGWTLANIPEDVMSVGLEMVAMKFKESLVGENLLGRGSVSASMSGGTSSTSYKDMLPVWSKRLAKFIHITV